MQKDDLTPDPDCSLDLERGNLNCVHDTPSHYALTFIKLASVIYKLLLKHDFFLRHNSTFDPTVALTLSVGT